jgi:uncharacterized membrane protein
MTTTIIYLLYFIGVIVTWIIFYYVIKAAVKNGIKEARNENEVPTNFKDSMPVKFASTEQAKLQQRYDKGEITFEVYQTEWNKLRS